MAFDCQAGICQCRLANRILAKLVNRAHASGDAAQTVKLKALSVEGRLGSFCKNMAVLKLAFRPQSTRNIIGHIRAPAPLIPIISIMLIRAFRGSLAVQNAALEGQSLVQHQDPCEKAPKGVSRYPIKWVLEVIAWLPSMKAPLA